MVCLNAHKENSQLVQSKLKILFGKNINFNMAENGENTDSSSDGEDDFDGNMEVRKIHLTSFFLLVSIKPVFAIKSQQISLPCLFIELANQLIKSPSGRRQIKSNTEILNPKQTQEIFPKFHISIFVCVSFANVKNNYTFEDHIMFWKDQLTNQLRPFFDNVEKYFQRLRIILRR